LIAVLWIAGALAVAGALGVVIAKTPVHSVISLVVNILALAALYLSLHAEFMALIQVIIYAGAIMILFLFVIALLTARKDPVERSEGKLEGQRELGIVAAVTGAILMTAVALSAGFGRPVAQEALPSGFGSPAAFGRELLTTHILSFELTAFVLMAAVIGVVVLVGQRKL
jgi:NADH:ubiquinone oxidoreductase subunit 6 (chain J)